MEEYLDNIFKEVDPAIKLDDNQKKVVLDESNNIIVIAGAGSGKTTTITAKVKYLVDIKKIKPKEILIISFTNKAINELKERINNDFKIETDILTFHSFAYKILKQFGWGYTLTPDYEVLIRRAIFELGSINKIVRLLKKDKVYRSNSHKYGNDLEYFIRFTVENIKLFKMNPVFPNNDDKYRQYYVYLEKILLLLDKYQSVDRFIDYEDMITLATKLLRVVPLYYKYIIVDEFQDISLNRYLLLKEAVKRYKVKTVVVGDDWQAIFSFAGSDSSIFLNFKKDMKAKLYKITNTYRNSKELIDVAGLFVMHNDRQIKKDLQSNKHLINPVIISYYHFSIIKKLSLMIDEIVKKYGIEKNILLLGRYNNDVNMIFGSSFYKKDDYIIYSKYKNLKIKYMTIHSSKGLGFYNVILLINKDSGFPSTKKEPYVRKNLISKESKILEERRLMYVAMTRTKNNFYILSSYFGESIFVKEIKKYPNVKIIK